MLLYQYFSFSQKTFVTKTHRFYNKNIDSTGFSSLYVIAKKKNSCFNSVVKGYSNNNRHLNKSCWWEVYISIC
ncbi:hypothetical protein GFV16_10315 [Bacillus megaterium]|nr:hypothetical protein [Priestia megaterium]PVE72770.1 hypothetical protein DC428_06805 [Priestia megaterium]PVE89559.1 hypothetical protein DC421_05705 [Priestia megaterium]PVE90795.1 hypothetical protein DC426_12825 [Priestia megaterium]PVE94517.1 hypothetical protein DC433_24510 [Priestia megaterium]